MKDSTTRFHKLHESGCFVIPNPWDAGSARLLAQMGFPALATTSSGYAWSTGRQDNHVTLGEALAHFRAMSSAVDVPVSGDFEGGFAVEPAAVAENVTAAAATGVAGLSIEDSTRDASRPLFEFGLAVERVRAARRAIDDSGSGVVLTGRSEGYIAGRPDLGETIRRLSAYRGRRRRLPLRAGAARPARHQGGRRRGRAETGQRPGRQWIRDRRRAALDRRAPHQRGRCPGPCRMDRLSRRRTRDRGRRDVHRPRSRDHVRQDQRVIRRIAIVVDCEKERFLTIEEIP